MDDVTGRARALAYELLDWNSVLAVLRTDGFSKTDCMRAMVELLQIPLGDAKGLVHNSQTWSDIRERDESILDELINDVTDLGAQTRPPTES